MTDQVTRAPRTDAKCWPFPCRDYHQTYAHTSGEDPCSCPCHPQLPMHKAAELTGGSIPAHVPDVYPNASCCGGPTRLADRLYCDTCPFETTDAMAARGHEHGPTTGRGWFGQHETHRLAPRPLDDNDDLCPEHETTEEHDAEHAALNLPDGATIDDDREALAQELMAEYAAAVNRRLFDDSNWSFLLNYATGRRHELIRAARLTADELATAAARFGIVADVGYLPLTAARASLTSSDPDPFARDAHLRAVMNAEIRDRQRETGDLWAAVQAARANKTTHEDRYYESSDGFTERHSAFAISHWPIYVAATH